MNDIIHTTGVKNERGYYEHIGITKNISEAKMYGVEIEDIEDITFKVYLKSDSSQAKINKQEYWGWYDNEVKKFIMIWPNYLLLHICFPYGLPYHEKMGNGKAFKLKLIEPKKMEE
jgi:hypothetical protein